jgi:hypothetical protein
MGKTIIIMTEKLAEVILREFFPEVCKNDSVFLKHNYIIGSFIAVIPVTIRKGCLYKSWYILAIEYVLSIIP